MSVITVESLVQPIPGSAPCGENLEYGELRDLEVLAAGKPERQHGDKVLAAEEPSWPDIKQKAIELFSKTKDLRVAALLTQALIRTDGLEGLKDGLEVLAQLITTHWPSVHPQPEADAPGDYTIRSSALAFLSDMPRLLNPIRRAQLVATPGRGRFSLRDIQIASGKIKPAQGESATQPAVIEAAFRECELGQLKATLEAVDRSLQYARDIDSGWEDRAGTRDLDVAKLTGVLQEIRKELQSAIASRPDAVADLPADETDNPGTGRGNGEAKPAPFTGLIRSREDVIRVLDSACDYLARHEPSSPVPLLLQRAKRLMVKDFLQIIQDLAPDAMTQVSKIGGIDNQP
jgi:type VI secretion system protein ImpA